MSGDAGLDPQAAQRLHDRRQHAIRDLEELSEQVADGELDEATAERLRAGYQAELEAVNAELGVVDDMPGQLARKLDEAVEQVDREPPPESDREPAPAGRSSGRAIVGGFLLIGAFTAVILIAAQTFRSDGDSGSVAPSNVATLDAAALEEMEDVIESHPDNTGMRMALADAYFDQGEYLSAIDHYVVVLSGLVTVEEESRALGRIGWMAYATGQNEAAVEYLDASLRADPGYAEGKLFLGMVRLYGLEDAAGALPLLEEVLALPSLTDEIRVAVEVATNDARAVLEEQ